MPTYKITDSQTGKTLRVTGDKPPTEQEMTEIFSQYQPKQKASSIEKFGEVFLPQVTKYGQRIEQTGSPRTQAQEQALKERDLGKFLGESFKAEFAPAADIAPFMLSGLFQAGTTATAGQRIVGQAGTGAAISGTQEAGRVAAGEDRTAQDVVGSVLFGAGVASGVQAIGEMARALKQAKFPDKIVQKVESEMDNVDRIISGAENAETKKKYALSGFRKVYQSLYPFSKKGNAFERLKPEETFDDMIKYGQAGSPNKLRANIQQITGRNGVLTNIVDDAIANVDNPNAVKVPEFNTKDLANKFSEIGSKEVRQQLLRITNLKPGNLPGQTKLSEMVKLERELKIQDVEDKAKCKKEDSDSDDDSD
jgi:hypothetical protein